MYLQLSLSLFLTILTAARYISSLDLKMPLQALPASHDIPHDLETVFEELRKATEYRLRECISEFNLLLKIPLLEHFPDLA